MDWSILVIFHPRYGLQTFLNVAFYGNILFLIECDYKASYSIVPITIYHYYGQYQQLADYN